MTTRIVQIYKLPARQYSVILECGHRPTVSAEQLMKQRLFIGARVRCAECAGKSGMPLVPERQK